MVIGAKKWNPVINFVGLASGIFQCELVIHATVIEKRKWDSIFHFLILVLK
jgi:hypothetical protein